jgi:hypothetical protein
MVTVTTPGIQEIDGYQVTVVKHIFRRYAETLSVSMVSGELNKAKIPSKGGGRWYPSTVRRVLNTESYTGRTFRHPVLRGYPETPDARNVIQAQAK